MALALTDTEIACGVDEKTVRREANRSLVFEGGTAVAVAMDHGPATAGAAAREKLGAPVEFAGLNSLGHAVYRKETR